MPRKKLPVASANARQVGGKHYNIYGDLQPWDVFMRWNLNPFCAYLLPYLVRYREKGGVADLEKALHVLEKWIEEEKRIAASRASASKSARARKRGVRK